MRNASTLAQTMLALILACCPLVAFSKEVPIYQWTDDFKGGTVYYTAPQHPKLEGGSFLSERYVFMSLKASTPISQTEPYLFQVDARLPGWMFIDRGESFVLKVDGEPLPLSGSGSGAGGGDRDIQLGGVTETAFYRVSLETLRKLAAAKSIQFRIYGTKNQITGEFTEEMLASIRLFADKVPALIGDPAFSIQPAPASSLASNVVVEFGADFADAWKFVLKMNAKVLGVPELHGVTVSRVASNSVAERAGLKNSDLIFEFDGKKFNNADELRSMIAAVQPRRTIAVGVLRARVGQKSEVIQLQATF